MKITRSIVGLSMILFLGFTTSCDLLPDQDLKDLGTLTIELNDQINARSTLVPELSMDPSDYIITGVGPEGRSFDPVSLSGGTESISGLYKGTWVITVTAMNDAGDDIGIGTVTVEIEPNRIKTAHVTVVPIAGEGTLTLSGGWVAEDIADPQILAELDNGDGDIEILDFTITDNTAEFSSDSISAGYYTLRLGLYDGPSDDINNRLIGTVVAVRIVAEHETRGILQVTSEDLNVIGNVKVTIENDLKNPYEVSLSISATSVFEGEDVTITASVIPEGDYNYEWYLNGDLLVGETEESITLGEDLRLGKHFVDVIVSGNGVLSSASAEFTVEQQVENNEGFVSFTLTPNDGTQPLDYVLTSGFEGPLSISPPWADNTYEFTGIPIHVNHMYDGEISEWWLVATDRPLPTAGNEAGFDLDPTKDIVMFGSGGEDNEIYGFYIYILEDEVLRAILFEDIKGTELTRENGFTVGSFSGVDAVVFETNDVMEFVPNEDFIIDGLSYSLTGELKVVIYDNHHYSLIYDSNEADEGTPPEGWSYVTGDNVPVASDDSHNLEKTGYEFSGWNTKPDGSGDTYQDGDIFIMGSEHVTLYAVWVEE